MTTKFIYTIFHRKTTVTEFTTDPDRAELMSKRNNKVICKRYKGVN